MVLLPMKNERKIYLLNGQSTEQPEQLLFLLLQHDLFLPFRK